jgi:TonB family protein
MLQWSMANLLAWAAQVAAIVAAGLALPVLLRVRSPGAKLVFFRALLIACMALPLLQPWAAVPATAPVPVEVQVPAVVSSAVAAQAELPPAQVAGVPPARPAPFQSLPWQTITIGILVIGIVCRLAWLGLGLLSLMRLRRSSTALDPQPEAVEDAALVVGARASFRVSPRVQRPVTFGLRWPVVLVPEGFLEFAPAEQSAIACHELLHVRRRDWLRTLAEEVVCAVLWFHPAIWWLIDRIHLSAEQVIDRHVVGLLGDRRSYLQALLRLAASGPEPMLQPAALFLKHGHLRQRVTMLIKETPMSRIRLAASFAVVLTALACGGWLVVQAFPLRADSVAELSPTVVAPSSGDVTRVLPAMPPPAGPASSVVSSASVAPEPQTRPTVDPKSQAPQTGILNAPVPGTTVNAKDVEAKLLQSIQAAPAELSNYVVLAGLYEKMGKIDQAEATLLKARGITPNDSAVYLQLAGFYNRQQQFDKTIDALRQRAVLEPDSPEAPYTIATYFWDKAYRDSRLSESQKSDYVAKGMEAVDVALRLRPDYMEALTYKNLLLRLQANIERDPSRQQALIKEAEALQEQAGTLKAQRDAQNAWAEAPANAVRVGGNIAPPQKLKDVKPVYPAIPAAARVQGIVIVEAVVGEDGRVSAARVVKSIALLDQAALDAVRQWEFRPTLLNGAPVPVVMTTTVNFTMASSGGGGGRGVGSGTGFGAGVSSGGAGGVTGGVAGGLPGGVTGGVVGDLRDVMVITSPFPPPPPPPPPPPAPFPPDTVRVGGNIRPPTKVVDVRPVYPAEARDAGIQGWVIIEAVISKEGKVTNARVLKSIPQLDEAALDAVRQWEFTPTTISGVPMNVVMTVTVNFTLQ